MERFLPYGTQCIEEDDLKSVAAVLNSSYLTQGPKLEEFEQALAEFVGAQFCIAFSSATAALHCSVMAMEIPVGSQGITSSNSFVASANCMAYAGLHPILSDIDARTYNVTADTLTEKIQPETRLLIPVHFAGQSCDMESISALAHKHGLAVIEDAAHAIGSYDKSGHRIGSCRFSDLTVFSFHPVKTITTGEGGAVTTNNARLAQKLKDLRSHGITRDPSRLLGKPEPWYYEQQSLGFNYRITEMQCALGISQLNKIHRFHERRRAIVNQYNAAFAGHPFLTTPYEAPGLNSCFHLYVLTIEYSSVQMNRSEFMKKLSVKGIGSQVHYIPIHTQPWYSSTFKCGLGDCPIAEAYYQKTLSLPLFPTMSDHDVSRVIATILELVSP